jgi:hypothetical protein
MGKFAICSVAMFAFASVVATVPASAEQNSGPLQQNGKCWKYSFGAAGGSGGHGFGYWDACAQPAGLSVVHTASIHHRRHRAHS